MTKYWITGVALAGAIVATTPARDAAPISLGIAGRTNANVSVAAQGSFAAVAWSAADDSGATDIYTAVSRDGGSTFSAPARVNRTPADARVNGEQPPRLALIPRAGQTPAIVAVWTAKRPAGTALLTARSDDGGRTFGETTVVPGGEAAGNRGWESIALDDKGEVHALWLDHREMAPPPAGSPHAGHDASAAAKKDGVAMAQLSKLYLSTVGSGSSARAIGGGVCYCCKTAIAAGGDGSLYAAWRHVYPGNLRDIAFMSSRDRGRTFSAPVRVSEDEWAIDGCPDDGPGMTVDARGAVRIVWPTLVAGPTPRKGIFYAALVDGRSFTERVRLDSGTADPAHPQLASASDGATVAVWDEVANGERRIVIRRSTGTAAFGEATILGGGRAVYPSAAAVSGGFVVAWTESGGGQSTIRLVRRDWEKK
jgi:hypothetical protein